MLKRARREAGDSISVGVFGLVLSPVHFDGVSGSWPDGEPFFEPEPLFLDPEPSFIDPEPFFFDPEPEPEPEPEPVLVLAPVGVDGLPPEDISKIDVYAILTSMRKLMASRSRPLDETEDQVV